MAEYYLGNIKNSQNHIKISDPSVSGNHLSLIYKSNGEVLIKDLGSLNGTKVNGQAILQKTIKSNDIIEIGQISRTGEWLIDEINKLKNKDKVIFVDEFQSLKPYFEEFGSKKRKIELKSSFKNQVVKIIILSIITILFSTFQSRFNMPTEIKFAVPILAGIIALVIGQRMASNDSADHLKRKLIEDYKKILRCPKCHSTLVHQSYESWQSQQFCNHCQAQWSIPKK